MALGLLLGGTREAPGSPAGQRSIRVVMDDNYPPFVFRDTAGELQGLLVDEWKVWEQRTGIKAEICGTDWGQALRRMKAGEFDVIDTVFKTPERAAYWEFSKPYARIDVPIFFQKEIGGITDLKSLGGFPVAAKEGDAAADLLRQNGITVLLFTNYQAVIEAAGQHKINVFVVDRPPALHFLHKLGLEEEFRQSAPLYTGEFRRAVKKGNAALLQTVERGFAAVRPAEMRRLEQKWQGYSLSNRSYLRQLSYVAGAAVLLLAGLGVWNLSLNRLVKLRTVALGESEQKFRNIFQNAPIAIFQSTLQGRLLNVNAAGVKMFGYDSPEQFLSAATDMARQLFVRPEQRPKIVNEALGCERYVRHEVEYRRQDGSVFLATLSMRAVRDESGQPVWVEGFVEDITQRKQAEARLQRTNRTLRMISECNQVLVRATDETDLLQAICRLAVEGGGYRMAWVGLAEQDEAKSVRPVARAGFEAGYLEAAKITWADNERGRGPTGTAIRTGQPVIARNLRSDPAFEPWRRAALERGYAASATFPLKGKAGVLGALMVYAAEPDTFDAAEVELLTELAEDLAYGITALRTRTERQRIEAELRRLSARLLQVRDQERRRLARELHDTTAQHLAALSLNLANLKRRLAQGPDSAQALCSECVELAVQAAQEIRTHSYLLHPPLLEVLGLAGAVEEYAQGFTARCGIAVELEAPPDFGRLPDDTELALFRVVQESLANVLKHSGSARAKICFTRQASLVILEIRDMGLGIPADKLARIKSLSGGFGVGLGGMQERLRLLGGRLEVESGPAGTTVRATVPLAGPAPELKSAPEPALPVASPPLSNRQPPIAPA